MTIYEKDMTRKKPQHLAGTDIEQKLFKIKGLKLKVKIIVQCLKSNSLLDIKVYYWVVFLPHWDKSVFFFLGQLDGTAERGNGTHPPPAVN